VKRKFPFNPLPENTLVNLLQRIRGLNLRYNASLLSVAGILAAISGILPMLLPMMMAWAINMIISKAPPGDLARLTAGFVLISLASALAAIISNSMCIKIGYDLGQQLALRVYSAIMRMPILTYSTINQGVLASRLTNDLRMIEPLFVEVPLSAIRGWAALIASAVALAFINVWFLAAFLVVPFSLLMVRFAERRIDTTISDSFEQSARVAAQIDSTTTPDAISLVRQARYTQRECLKFAEAAGGVARTATKLDFWRFSVGTFYDTSFAIVTVVLLGIGAQLAADGKVSVANVVAVILYLGLLRHPLSQLVGLRYPMMRASIGLGRVESILCSPNTNLSSIDGECSSIIPDHAARGFGSNGKAPVLVFEDVWFKYPTREEVAVDGLSNIDAVNNSVGFVGSFGLTNLAVQHGNKEESQANDWTLSGVSFEVALGQSVAIAGMSGAGKSTIVGLACGMLRPTQGKVYINGFDTCDLAEEEVWRRVSLVSQDIFLRDSTLKENLIYGLQVPDDAIVLDVCRLAGLSGLLEGLPEGLNTRVGVSGKRFSGGERQRIAIARAILKNTNLLVLDEATSHLDSIRESDVIASIELQRKSKGVLLVAHRSSAIHDCNQIHVIDNGVVVESGTHKELMDRGGHYSRVIQTAK
jgi:ATP-binding cassette, subfamily B, bacterial